MGKLLQKLKKSVSEIALLNYRFFQIFFNSFSDCGPKWFFFFNRFSYLGDKKFGLDEETKHKKEIGKGKEKSNIGKEKRKRIEEVLLLSNGLTFETALENTNRFLK